MAPGTPNENPNQPNQPVPPKRDTSPLSVPTVGLGKDQVRYISCTYIQLNMFNIKSDSFFLL